MAPANQTMGFAFGLKYYAGENLKLSSQICITVSWSVESSSFLPEHLRRIKIPVQVDFVGYTRSHSYRQCSGLFSYSLLNCAIHLPLYAYLAAYCLFAPLAGVLIHFIYKWAKMPSAEKAIT